MKQLRYLVIFAAVALLAACNTNNHKQTIALFGGSFSVTEASNVATDFWAEQLNAEITKYGVGGAGFLVERYGGRPFVERKRNDDGGR